MIYHLQNTAKAAKLFENWQETMIWSCLQNIMGAIYVTDLKEPQAAMAKVGDFCFFAGQPAKELVLYELTKQEQDFLIMVPQNDAWADLIAECYGDRAVKTVRYAIKKEPDIFERERLKAAVSAVEPEYTVRLIDEALYHRCLAESWSRDLVGQFPDYESFRRLGVGVCALQGERVVSGASSYSRYREGIEIEIDTHKDFRRQGLAFACGAGLILECLDRGLYPSWDAQNLGSVALAEKLGYHFDYEYPAFEIHNSLSGR